MNPVDKTTKPTIGDFFRNNTQYFLGIKTMNKSKYKPSVLKDPKSEYYTYPNIKSDALGVLKRINEKSKTPKYAWDEFLKIANDGSRKYLNGISLGHFKTSVGEDKKGKYISIYDTFNWDAIPANSYELYDRIYEDDFRSIMGDGYF